MYYYSGFPQSMTSVPTNKGNQSVLEKYEELAKFYITDEKPKKSSSRNRGMYYYSGFPQSMTSVPSIKKNNNTKKILLLGGLFGLFYFLTRRK